MSWKEALKRDKYKKGIIFITYKYLIYIVPKYAAKDQNLISDDIELSLSIEEQLDLLKRDRVLVKKNIRIEQDEESDFGQ